MKNTRFRAFCTALVEIVVEHKVLRIAAGLSYFLMMSIFPMLICLYNMLGAMFPASEEIREFLDGLLPSEATNMILDFLRYVSANTSTGMLFGALLVMLSCSSAGYRMIDDVMGEMRGGRRYTGFWELLFSILFSMVFLAAMYLAAILIVTGRWFLSFVDSYISFVNISDSWTWVRFLLLFLLLFVLLSLIYRFTAPRGAATRQFPGALLGALAMLAVSIVFSAFIGRSSRYPLVYGSLASVIIMLFWLYVCGTVLFLGNAVNVALERVSSPQKRG